MSCVQRIVDTINDSTTVESLSDTVKDVQNDSSFSVVDRAALAVYAICANVTVYSEIPAVLDRFGAVVRNVGTIEACHTSSSANPRWRSV